jgi:hypothetical protein
MKAKHSATAAAALLSLCAYGAQNEMQMLMHSLNAVTMLLQKLLQLQSLQLCSLQLMQLLLLV